jgi:hypothetical protein
VDISIINTNKEIEIVYEIDGVDYLDCCDEVDINLGERIISISYSDLKKIYKMAKELRKMSEEEIGIEYDKDCGCEECEEFRNGN